MFLLLKVAASVPRGALAPSKTHKQIVGEFGKAARFLRENKDLATKPVSALSLDRNQKTVLKSQIGATLNVDQKGIAAIRHTATQIRQQIKFAGNKLKGEKKHLLEGQAEAAEATADFLEAFASGKSLEQAFSKKNGWFFGYSAVDRFIRATISIAEKGGNPNVAIENMKLLEPFKGAQVVSAALTKNATKLGTIKTNAENSREAAFEETSNEVAMGGREQPPIIPSEIDDKYRGGKKEDAEPQYAMPA